MTIKKSNALLLFVICYLVITQGISAQEMRAVWGEVPKADLEMKEYLQDTSASALILSDYGESSFNDDLDLVFIRHLRVKIFNSKGYSWGAQSIQLYTEKNTERITQIEGITYSLDEQGNVKQTKLNGDDIFKEEIDNSHTKYKFTLPQLKPGCIIDIKYKITANNFWYIQDWVFQHEIPVRWSEYIVRSPRNIEYSGVNIGYEPYEINNITEVTQDFSLPAVNYLGHGSSSQPCPCYEFHWAVKNLSALKNEPYITTMKDYYKRVELQLAGYALNGKIHHVMNDWITLVNELVDDKYFGKRIDDTGDITDKAKEITKGLTLNEEKIKAIYDWVSKTIAWDGKHRLYAERDVDDVLKSSKGNSAEIAFLFLSMLKSIGIEGDPVILSTRSNGKVQNAYPIISQFNYVLSRVKTNNGLLLIDPTSSTRPMELLSTEVLNTRGLLIKRDSVNWVKVTSLKEDKSTSITLINLNKDGSITGMIEKKYEDYEALNGRNSLKDSKEINLANEDFDSEIAGFNIDSITIKNKSDRNLPLLLKSKISSTTYSQVNGELIYINPHIIDIYRNNPFKSKTRKFPLDYAYRRNFASNVIIIIPKGYEIKEIPKDAGLSAADGLLTYTRFVQSDSDRVQLKYNFNVKSTEIKPEYYNEIKKFYEQMISAESEQLVLSCAKKEIPVVTAKDEKVTASKEVVKNAKSGKKKK